MICRPPQMFVDACRALGITLSVQQADRLAHYLNDLLETNKQFNLTSVRDGDEAWMRHILDSLSLLPFLGEARSLIDIGSGGGLPGVPIGLIRLEIKVTLLEATGKKATFLERITANMANGCVLRDRAEIIGQDRRYRERFDLAVARAVGPLNVMLEYALPLVGIGGRVLAMKGQHTEQELNEAGDAIMQLGGGPVNVYEAMPTISDTATIVEIVKQKRTPRQYPRSPGTPKLDPL